MNDIVPSSRSENGSPAKRCVTAVGSIAGAVTLFVLGSLPPIAGIIAGAVVGLVGFTALASKDPGDRFPGLVAAGAGILTIASRLPFIKALLGGPSRFLLGIGAFGLLTMGIWNLVRFFKEMKSRV